MSIFTFIEANSKLVGFIVLSATTATTGGVLALTNAGNDESEYLFKSVGRPEHPDSYGSYATHLDEEAEKKLSVVRHSYKEILEGTKKFNGGNYVLYYGSQACTHCTGLIYGDHTLSRGNLWSERDKMSDGAWMKAYHFTRVDKELKDKKIEFLMYEDIPEVDPNSSNDVTWTLPWTRWPANDVAKGIVTGDYVRNDKSSKDFRRLFEAAQTKFGDKVAGTPTVILYKEGEAVVFGRDKLNGLPDEPDKDYATDIELKRYIKYYYTKIADTSKAIKEEEAPKEAD